MTTTYTPEQQNRDLEISSQADRVQFHFQPSRREVLQILGAGILIAAWASAAPAAGGRAGRGGGLGGAAPANLLARIHIGKDGTITVLCGKVEGGQGVRAEVTLATAEELAVTPAKIAVLLADTDLTPNDGPTVGSQSTPRTIPSVRQAAAAAKQLLLALAASTLGVAADQLTVNDGTILHPPTGKKATYADLASTQNLEQALTQAQIPANITITPTKDWKHLGQTLTRPNARDQRRPKARLLFQ